MSRRLRFSRRKLLAAGAVAASTSAARRSASAAAAESKAGAFTSRWDDDVDRVWLGADYWANPLQDWRVRDGAAECTGAAPNRNVHLLTRQLADRAGDFEMSVVVGRTDGSPLGQGKGSAGFRIGIQGPLGDYRNALLYGKGLDAGFTAAGGLFIGAVGQAKAGTVRLDDATSVTLSLSGRAEGENYALALRAADAAGNELGAIRKAVPAAQLAGNVALVCNFGGETTGPNKGKGKKPAAGPGVGAFRFAKWTLAGDKFEAHDDRAFGPVLFTQYTLSQGTLKLTAQLPPLGAGDAPQATLVVGGRSFAAPIHPQARTATFRVDGWDASRDVPYRVVYELKSRSGAAKHEFSGVVRREPADKPVLAVADVSCNIHAAFPNDRYVEHVRKLDPDLLAFVGDQFYESTGGYGVTTAPLDVAIVDYLRKWYVHGWTWRELTRDRPSISIPDDHDVYQGNIWGESGAPQTTTQEAGGYRMPAEWVNVVHRTQTAHHPDPYDASPVKQGITQYFGRMAYGGVDFAILADRMYKSAPEGKVPPTGGRGDHVTDPNFDPRTADLPGLELLGPVQEKFLAEWADDWSAADVKAVVSQTIFTAMATHHGGPHERLIADYDTNGWPQSARRRAVELIRRARAFHLAGDQHLPALIQYGIEKPRDAGYAFAGPAVNVGYPRWWEPASPGENRAPGAPENTGDFRDHFGNWLTVVAVANGALKPRPGVLEGLADKASGLGIVRFDKLRRKITIDCWPLSVDPTAPDAEQFAGWPVTIDIPPKPTT